MKDVNLKRLKDCMKRAEAGEELTIGFLGGSITQGSLATTMENTYAYRVFTWWKQTFPKANVHYVNGGIGGTTSHYGVSRAVTDVLMYQPDFIVVDFSVNDEADIFFQETYEGVVRKLLSWDSKPAVVLLNNVFYDTGLNAQIHDIAQGGIALMDGQGWFHEPDQIGMESAWNKIRFNKTFGELTEWDFNQYTPQVVVVAIGQNDNHPFDYMSEDYMCEKAILWREHYTEFLKKLRQVYPKASVVCCTTLLEHDSSWDKAIDDVVVSMGDSKISHCIFKRNGAATPGHLRIPETYEMARELADYIENLGIEEWK